MLNLAFVSTLKSKVWSTKPATSFGRKPTGEPYKKCISMLVKYKSKKRNNINEIKIKGFINYSRNGIQHILACLAEKKRCIIVKDHKRSTISVVQNSHFDTKPRLLTYYAKKCKISQILCK
jgi:hypothetical protein